MTNENFSMTEDSIGRTTSRRGVLQTTGTETNEVLEEST